MVIWVRNINWAFHIKRAMTLVSAAIFAIGGIVSPLEWCPVCRLFSAFHLTFMVRPLSQLCPLDVHYPGKRYTTAKYCMHPVLFWALAYWTLPTVTDGSSPTSIRPSVPELRTIHQEKTPGSPESPSLTNVYVRPHNGPRGRLGLSQTLRKPNNFTSRTSSFPEPP